MAYTAAPVQRHGVWYLPPNTEFADYYVPIGVKQFLEARVSSLEGRVAFLEELLRRNNDPDE